jgi:hypothetical protein
MPWFARKCPVARDEQAWIEDSTRWLVQEFGSAVVRRPIVTPTREFFPVPGFTGHENVSAVLALVAAHMGVAMDSIDLEYVAASHGSPRPYVHAYSGPAGHYHEHEGRGVLTVYGAETASPVTLVATLAHELGHARLLGENRVDWDRPDGEPLTDLLTVVFGFGIFTANAAFEFDQDHRGWRSQRLGYMTEQMFGYALARYALLRGEPAPRWAAHLDVNPRAYMKQALRYLTHHP